VSIPHDSFTRTAAALQDTWRAHRSLSEASPAQFRNYMLDLCGSDTRALVDLVLSVGADVRTRVTALDANGPWDRRRAPIVHHLVSTRFLQPDVARWLVDSWGAALGVAPAQIERPQIQYSMSEAESSTAFTRAVSAIQTAATPVRPAPLVTPANARRSVAAVSGLMSRSRNTAAPGNAPVPTGGIGGGHAPTHPAMARQVAPRRRQKAAAMTAVQAIQIKRIERISFVVIGACGVFVFVAGAIGIKTKKADAVAAASAPPAINAELVAAGAIAKNSSANDTTANDTTTTNATSASSNAANVSSPITSGMSVHADGSDLIAVTTPRRHTDGPHLIAGGLGGKYRVHQASVSVNGSPSCTSVADALSKSPPTTETITHLPGTFTFTLASRGVSATLSPDAYFDAGPQRGVTDGVTWEFWMHGQFRDGGFTAQTTTTTEAILRWGSMQRCATVIDLVGTQLPR